jgi:hypothetical protein
MTTPNGGAAPRDKKPGWWSLKLTRTKWGEVSIPRGNERKFNASATGELLLGNKVRSSRGTCTGGDY